MIDLSIYGFNDRKYPGSMEGTIPARIMATHRERYNILCEKGEASAQLKASVYYIDYTDEPYPTVGDFVLIRYNPLGESQIMKTLPRTSYFTRKDPDVGRGEQAVAANFDYVFLFTSLNEDFNIKRLERYLAVARQSGAEPVIILTKADLTENFTAILHQTEQVAMGTKILIVSAKSGYGMKEAEAYLQPGKTIVCLGSSGVGKSSLINELAGVEIMKVNTIREEDDKGRHTTTHRQLVLLSSGAMIIDTPGMRELGLWSADAGLDEAFADVEVYLGQCKFSDCTHQNEPDCAVRAALNRGDLSLDRWQRYLRLKEEVTYNEDKQKFMQQRKEWSKSIAKKSRQMKKANKIQK
ncbi:MAG TPA: ribosome small subunit-dependent GTPase A [Bacillota bacterium]|nr:ribosome small subunit-dependent GTPase A [Bacillota bacterium]